MPQSIILKEESETYSARAYVDLKADFAFKQMFAQEDGKPILVSFLNALLESNGRQVKIVSVQILNTDLEREHRADKKAVLDLLARSDDGTFFHVEIQLVVDAYMADRQLYYWSRVYTKQLKKGAPYSSLNRTISILISNADMLKQTARHHSQFGLYEAREHFLLTDRLEIHVIELQKLLKAQASGDADPWKERDIRWLLMLAAVQGGEIQTHLMKELEAIAVSTDTELMEAFERWEDMSRDPAVWAKYEMWHKRVMDEAARQAEEEAARIAKEQHMKDVQQLELARQKLDSEKRQLDSDKQLLDSEKQRFDSDKQLLDSEKQRFDSDKQLLDSEKQRLDSDKQLLDSEKQRLDSDKQLLDSEKQRLDSDKQLLDSEKRQLASAARLLQSESDELKQRLLQTGKNMLRSGIPVVDVVAMTGLTAEELLD